MLPNEKIEAAATILRLLNDDEFRSALELATSKDTLKRVVKPMISSPRKTRAAKITKEVVGHDESNTNADDHQQGGDESVSTG